MALTSTDNGPEYTNCGNASVLNGWTAFTYFGWVYFNDLGGFSAPRILSKGSGLKDMYSENTGNPTLIVGRSGVNGTAYASGPHPSGEWIFYVGTYDETDGPRLFIGTLSTPVAEVDYAARTVGTLATTDDSASLLYLANRPPPSSQNRGFGGRIAVAGAIEKRLTLAELQSIQYTPKDILKWSEAKGLWDLHGTGTQPDLSGNGNNGTVVAASAADHIPLARMINRSDYSLARVSAGPPPLSMPAILSANQPVIGA